MDFTYRHGRYDLMLLPVPVHGSAVLGPDLVIDQLADARPALPAAHRRHSSRA
ncbi:hypothetical protein AB0H77_42160 [Streptomyces sp. NPDC050844]|uniref:hypothetical protein n=1 Tax=Streptomyces sp. NPDC050844 TaxID=3155790 RepID=UPI00340BF155